MSELALAKIQNVLWEIKLIPTTIEVAYKSNKCMKDPSYIEKLDKKRQEKEERKAAKQDKKLEKEMFKAAREQSYEQSKEPFSESVKAEIQELTKDDPNGLNRLNLVGKAVETNKLIQYAFFYMTNEKAEIIKLKGQIEREIVNGISELLEFGKIYESEAVANLNLYDSESEEYLVNSNYLLSVKDILAKKNDSAFMEKMQERKEQLWAEAEHPTEDEPENGTSKWYTDENGIVHPIFVVSDDENKPLEEAPVQGVGISDELFSKLQEAFEPFLADSKYRYELFGDLVKLYITREQSGVEEFYIVDPGYVMGCGKVYLLANIGNDTLFVSTDHVDIIKNILSTAFYILRPEEIQSVIQNYFRNMAIYRYVDMTGTDFLKDLNADDFQKLGKKLTFIINQVSKQNGNGNVDLPRFRFNYWNGIDDFLIISDPTVKSPLAMTNETSVVICEGLMFEVKGDDITQRLKGSMIQYHIDKYGDM